MLRMLFGAPSNVLRSIVSKYIKKLLKKQGMSAFVDIKDFVVYEEGDELLVHVNGDVKIKKSELLNYLNHTMDET